MGYIISSKRQIRQKNEENKEDFTAFKGPIYVKEFWAYLLNPICLSALTDPIPPYTPKNSRAFRALQGDTFLFPPLQSDFSSILVFCQRKLNSFPLPLWVAFQHAPSSTLLIFLLQSFLTQYPPPNITPTGSFLYQGHWISLCLCATPIYLLSACN